MQQRCDARMHVWIVHNQTKRIMQLPPRSGTPPLEHTDWRCVSQHHIQEVRFAGCSHGLHAQSSAAMQLVETAVDRNRLHETFRPSIIIAAGEDALSVSRMLRAVLKAKTHSGIPILTSSFQLYDEEANPYNPITGPWGNS